MKEVEVIPFELFALFWLVLFLLAWIIQIVKNNTPKKIKGFWINGKYFKNDQG